MRSRQREAAYASDTLFNLHRKVRFRSPDCAWVSTFGRLTNCDLCTLSLVRSLLFEIIRTVNSEQYSTSVELRNG